MNTAAEPTKSDIPTRLALILALLAVGETRISGAVTSDAAQNDIDMLRALGAGVTMADAGGVCVRGAGLGSLLPPRDPAVLAAKMRLDWADAALTGVLSSHPVHLNLADASADQVRLLTDMLPFGGRMFAGAPGPHFAGPATIVPARLNTDDTLTAIAAAFAALNAPGTSEIAIHGGLPRSAQTLLTRFGARITSRDAGLGSTTYAIAGQHDLLPVAIDLTGDLT